MGDKNGRKRYLNDQKPNSIDDPPNSRLFIICSKQLTEEDFREAFSKFGEIEQLSVVKDRNSGEPKGVAYVKYGKTSEAAAALEAMNGKIIGGTPRQIKVMVAATRDQGSKRDGNEEEKMLRLFVMVPKTMTNEELYAVFRVYGDIEYASVIKNKEKNESKGFAYIKFHKFSHAAAAFEQCDPKYRAVFAEPRKPRQSEPNFDQFYSNNYRHESPRGGGGGGVLPLPEMDSDGFTSVQVISSPMLNQDQIWKLFDIVPGMDYCQSRMEGNSRPDRLVSFVVYDSPRSAAYALEKLHGFEYPIGSRLIVKPDYNTHGFSEPRGGERLGPRGGGDRSGGDRGGGDRGGGSRESFPRAGSKNVDLAHLAETIKQATSIIQAAGYSPSDLLSSNEYGSKKPHCSVDLPDAKPILNSDTEMEARCFIVCTQQVLPVTILRDVFCRFGSLIDVYLLPNRNCGYVKYGSRSSAEHAIRVLNGAEICGVRMKVMEAEEPGSKRMRLDYD